MCALKHQLLLILAGRVWHWAWHRRIERERAPQKGLLGCCDTAAVCQWRNEANPSSSACICINNTAEQHGIQLYTREEKINTRGREQRCVMLPVHVCTCMFCQPVTITQHDKAQHIYIGLCKWNQTQVTRLFIWQTDFTFRLEQEMKTLHSSTELIQGVHDTPGVEKLLFFNSESNWEEFI